MITTKEKIESEEDKRICPLLTYCKGTTLLAYCKGAGCAWWADGNCAIVNIVDELDALRYLLKRNYGEAYEQP